MLGESFDKKAETNSQFVQKAKKMTYILGFLLQSLPVCRSDAGEVENGESLASPSTVRQLRFACVHIIRSL